MSYHFNRLTLSFEEIKPENCSNGFQEKIKAVCRKLGSFVYLTFILIQ